MTRARTDSENFDQRSDEAEPVEPERGGGAPAAAGSEVDQLRAERDTLFERLARATADFQNARKRLQADNEQAVQYANAQLIKSLLPVIDNFERALAVDPAKSDASSILKGMQIVHDQWMNVLKQQEVEEIDPKPGESFDPERHQALMQEDAGKLKPGTVVRTLQKGYALHGRTLRPAQVAVARGA
jgi:molecular chaperone GrpE